MEMHFIHEVKLGRVVDITTHKAVKRIVERIPAVTNCNTLILTGTRLFLKQLGNTIHYTKSLILLQIV